MLTGDVPAALLDAVRRAGLDSVDGAFAYSGGVDSAYLAHVAVGCLGARALAVTARSASLM